MAVNFSCAPEAAGRLADLALAEVEALQAAGPSAEEVRPGTRPLTPQH